jgi:hypothetical protein
MKGFRQVAARAQSALDLKLAQAPSFHLLASTRENICDLVLPNFADASSCTGENCTNTTLATKKTDDCTVVHTFAF